MWRPNTCWIPCGTRPFVRLVAHYDKARQLFVGSFSKSKIIGILVALGTLAPFWGVDPGEFRVAAESLVQAMPVLAMVWTALLIWFAMDLTGQVSIRRDFLTLDLNGFYYTAPDGPRTAP